MPLEKATVPRVALFPAANAGMKQEKQITAMRQSEIIVFFFMCFILSQSEMIGLVVCPLSIRQLTYLKSDVKSKNILLFVSLKIVRICGRQLSYM